MRDDAAVTAEKNCTSLTLKERIESEQNARNALYSILRFCKTGQTTSQIMVNTRKEIGESCVFQNVGTLVTWLQAEGGICVFSMQDNEQIWQTTKQGLELITEEDSNTRLMNLLENEKSMQELYMLILNICKTPRTRKEIETAVQPLITEEHHDISPAYWEGKWHTTERGIRLSEFAVSQK
mgnify:CR=1 FL=1